MRNRMWRNKISPKESESEYSALPRWQEDEDAQLLLELRGMYEWEKRAAIDRVWTRLVSERTREGTVPFGNEESKESAFQKRRSFAERNREMQQLEYMPAHQKRLPRVFGLFAAVLVSLVLVGSLLLATNVMKDTALTTTSSSSSICGDTFNSFEQKLCIEHKETTLNIAKSFGTHKVVFVRAYADSTHLLIIYMTSDSPMSDAVSFMGIEIQHKNITKGGESWSYQDPKTGQWYYIISFDMPDVPVGTKQIQVQSITDGFSGKATPLQFTIPFHAEKDDLVG